MSDTKQVIIIRKDLKMRRGKECAQASHASLAFLTRRIESEFDKGPKIELCLSQPIKDWILSSYKKVTLQVDSEEELRGIFDNARKAGLEAHLITDSGLTEFDGVPTVTCLAIGPDYSDKIDEVTGYLKLY